MQKRKKRKEEKNLYIPMNVTCFYIFKQQNALQFVRNLPCMSSKYTFTHFVKVLWKAIVNSEQAV